MSRGKTDLNTVCAVGLSTGMTSGDQALRKTLALKDRDGATHLPKKEFGHFMCCLKLFTEQNYITFFSNLSLFIVLGPMRAKGKASFLDDVMRIGRV